MKQFTELDFALIASKRGWQETDHPQYGRAFFNLGLGIPEDDPWCVDSWYELCADHDLIRQDS